MKKEIVLRIENEKGEISEYAFQTKRWRYVLEQMFLEGGITVKSKTMEKLLATCDDDCLVGNALSCYKGRLSTNSINLIKERFWNSEYVQLGLLGYAGQYNCRAAAETVNPMTPYMRREVEAMLEVMK